ncbi:calcium ion binding [Branchiostoma belcheri]|nr:calcium ion binding [Branchiostoma belcheri]
MECLEPLLGHVWFSWSTNSSKTSSLTGAFLRLHGAEEIRALGPVMKRLPVTEDAVPETADGIAGVLGVPVLQPVEAAELGLEQGENQRFLRASSRLQQGVLSSELPVGLLEILGCMYSSLWQYGNSDKNKPGQGCWGHCKVVCLTICLHPSRLAIAVSASCGGSCTGDSSQTSPCNRHCPHGAPNGPSCNCADTGYSGTCCDNDIDECARGTHHCHQHANCTNTEGSYRCVCNNGYTGNGRTCTERNAPDLVSCPDDTPITVNSPDGGLLDWTDPEFRFQPSNELADHECSANKGDAAPIGTHNVQCWAEGYADGTTCDFDVIVQAPECVVPAPPRNGAVTCGVAEGAQKYCSVSCQNSYDFAIAPADTYRCDVYGVWHPEENLQWPDCSRVYRPGRARQKNELYYYSGSCASNEEDIKRNLRLLYATLGDCSAGIRCGISDIGVTCGPSSRKRRDTPRDSELSKDNVDIVVKRSCSPGFEYWNGACYFYSPNRNKFLSAESDCDSRGATLVVVPDSATHQYLVQKARGKRFIWIGLSDRAREGRFVWSNGVSLGSFHPWRGRNNARLDCVAMVKFRKTYVWRVRGCSGKLNYFCQK